MSSSEKTRTENDEDLRVRAWRFSRFVTLGFEDLDAAYLAARPLVDTHYVKRLLDRGCSHERALDILL